MEIDYIQEVLENIIASCKEKLESQQLAIHVFLCHDTQKEIKAYDDLFNFFEIYINAICDVAKEFNIDLEKERRY
jgi:hypothetical protein